MFQVADQLKTIENRIENIETKIDNLTRVVTATLLTLINSRPSSESASISGVPTSLPDLPNEPNGPETLEDSDLEWSEIAQE